jgi:hypothetical protein
MRTILGSALKAGLAPVIVNLVVLSFASAQSDFNSTEKLVRESEIVAVCKVTATTAEWDRTKSRIVTRVKMAVGEYLKGGAGEVITVTCPGGEVDGVGEWYSHTARFTRDEHVVLFAGRDSRGDLRVQGGASGKISIKNDEGTAKASVSGQMTLEDLKARIRTVVQTETPE